MKSNPRFITFKSLNSKVVKEMRYIQDEFMYFNTVESERKISSKQESYIIRFNLLFYSH